MVNWRKEVCTYPYKKVILFTMKQIIEYFTTKTLERSKYIGKIYVIGGKIRPPSSVKAGENYFLLPRDNICESTVIYNGRSCS
jgi:hypothetical protein